MLFPEERIDIKGGAGSITKIVSTEGTHTIAGPTGENPVEVPNTAKASQDLTPEQIDALRQCMEKLREQIRALGITCTRSIDIKIRKGGDRITIECNP